jgi:nucleoside-diphosphate-sugar epimerase
MGGIAEIVEGLIQNRPNSRQNIYSTGGLAIHLFATGVTGTIGRHLNGRVDELPVRLNQISSSVQIPTNKDAAIIHLAAVVGEQNVCSSLEYSYDVNVHGTAVLARAVAENPSQRFVYVSTSHVYASPLSVDSLNESAPLLPRGQYALQKLIAEKLVTEIFRDDPSRLVIARVFSVLDHAQPVGTLANSIIALRSDATRTLSYIDDERDFLSPGSIADALVAVAFSTTLSGIINICSGKPNSVRAAVRYLLGDIGYESVAPQLSAGKSTAPRIVGNPQRLNEVGLSGDELFAKSLHDWECGQSSHV